MGYVWQDVYDTAKFIGRNFQDPKNSPDVLINAESEFMVDILKSREIVIKMKQKKKSRKSDLQIRRQRLRKELQIV